jgi:prepilin-type N-terminal cleavage/methylation domain-containing protein
VAQGVMLKTFCASEAWSPRRLSMSARHAHRCGFTLVEMMVAMALTVFVMVILSECFVAGLETFSGLKAIGDMQEQLRTATNMLRADLSADHFEGNRRLSDPNIRTERIREGFFEIGQQRTGPGDPPFPPMPGLAGAFEGSENGVPSIRATEHWLHFTVKMRGNARDRFFAAPAPGLGNLAPNLGHQSPDVLFQESPNVLHSAWAEVAYILLPTGSTINPQVAPELGKAFGGTVLYALYRCVYVIVSDTSVVNARGLEVRADGSPYVNIAGQILAPAPARKSVMRFLNPNEQASSHAGRTFNPYLYFQMGRAAPHETSEILPRGAALVLSNVVSFYVQVLKSPSATGEFDDLNLRVFDSRTNKIWLNLPFDTAHYVNAASLPPVFSVAPPTPPPPPYTITGLKIVLRIWDPKSRLTRQVTLMQDM